TITTRDCSPRRRSLSPGSLMPCATRCCRLLRTWPPRRSSPTRWSAPKCASSGRRSEEHTSELQSRFDLVCRLLLEKKKKTSYTYFRCLGPTVLNRPPPRTVHCLARSRTSPTMLRPLQPYLTYHCCYSRISAESSTI